MSNNYDWAWLTDVVFNPSGTLIFTNLNIDANEPSLVGWEYYVTFLWVNATTGEPKYAYTDTTGYYYELDFYHVSILNADDSTYFVADYGNFWIAGFTPDSASPTASITADFSIEFDSSYNDEYFVV